ncbi:hypothetical protein IAT38_002804 [Cryptococcus sp. DSM 104549]
MGEDIDPTALAAVLAAEHPLIDAALISALLSDYESSALSANLTTIKDYLGILEATLVPDADDPNAGGDGGAGGNGSWAGSEGGQDPEVDVEDDWGRYFEMGPGSGVTSLNEQMGGLSIGTGSTGEGGIEFGEDDPVFADEMELLEELFPLIKSNMIHDALSSETSIDATINHLLSLDLFREVQERGYWPDEDEDEDDGNAAPPLVRMALPVERSERPDQWAPVIKPKSPQKQNAELSGGKKKKSKARPVPLVDTLQRRGTPISTSGRSSRSGSASGTTSSTPGSSPPSAWAPQQTGSQNQKQHLSSLASYLAQQLPPHPQTYFYEYLLAPQWASTYEAAYQALAHLPRGARGTTNEDEMSRKLLQDYRSKADDGKEEEEDEEEVRARTRDLEVCAKVAGQDVAAVMDLLDLLKSLRGAEEEDMIEDELEPEDDIIDLGVVSVGSATVSGGWAKPLAPPKTSNLPGPVTRPSKPTKPFKTARPVPGSVASTTTPNLTDTFGQAHPSVTVVPKRAQHPDNWQTVSHAAPKRLRPTHSLAASIPAYARGTTPHDNTPGSLYVAPLASFGPRGPSVADCIAQAQAEMKRREIAIRSAVRNFSSSSKATRGAVAGHYANQAREATERARKWQQLASELVVESQNDNFRHAETRNRDVDLHHLTRAEATLVALNAAKTWWAYEGERRAEPWGPAGRKEKDGRLVVIVGVGRHSVGRKGVLGPAVYKALDEAGWKVGQGEADRGYLVVRGKK